MTLMRYVLLVGLLVWVHQAWSDISPKSRKVKLTLDTQLTIYILPDAGVRLKFPFDLNDPKFDPPLRKELINKDTFIENDAGGGEGILDSIILSVKIPKKGSDVFFQHTYEGMYFLSIGPYNLTARLVTTTNRRRHVANYFFEIDKQMRDYLIQEGVKRRVAELENKIQRQTAQLDAQAQRLAMGEIGYVLANEPDKNNIKRELKIKGRRSDVRVDFSHFLAFDKYLAFIMFVDNDTPDVFFIKNGQVTYQDRKKKKSLAVGTYCPSVRPNKRRRCAFVTDVTDMKDSIFLEAEFTTSHGKARKRLW